MTDSVPCPNCGKSVQASEQFCQSCGTDVSAVTPTVITRDPESAGPTTAWDVILEELQSATEGRFRIERELGHGGMAAVYLAHEIALDRKVAIKVMSPAVLMHDHMVDRFRMEAVTIANLKHPNIVTVHGVEHHGQLHFFVLEFVEGRSLEAVIRQYGALPVPVVQAWLAQVGAALDYAHARGVVHRDIKPANTLIDGDGNAIVTDFGIAKVEEQPGFTQTGVVVGTPAYMSPEQCLGQKVTGASDQYSLGIVAYEMLTGEPPYEGSTLTVMHAHTAAEPVALLEQRPDCPEPLAEAVMRMLAKAPEERWPRLAAALAHFGGAPPAPHDPVQAQLAQMSRGEDATELIHQLPTPITKMPGAHAPSRSASPTMLARAGLTPSRLWTGGAIGALGITMWVALTGNRAPAVATLRVAPTAVTVGAGDSARLQVEAFDASNVLLDAVSVAWASSDTTVARVEDGVVVGVGPGTVTIETRVGDQVARSTVTVGAGVATVASVTATPSDVRIVVGEETTITAVTSDGTGAPILDVPIAWRSSDASVAIVSVDGVVRGVAPGATAVVGSVEDQSVEVTVTVVSEPPALARVGLTPDSVTLEPGATRTVVAVPLDAGGNQIGGRGGVVWRSEDPSIARVAPDGTITGIGVGSTVVVASIDQTNGRVMVTVNPEAVASVSILPTRVPLQVGQTAELITTVVGSRGTNLSGRSVTWRTTNAQIASVSPAGVVTAVAEGSATVTATTGGVSGQAAVIVTAPDPGVTRPLLDDETVVSSIRATVSGFVSNLNDALQSRTMEDIRSAYGVALPASDGDYWQTLVQTGDFRDFEVEMLRMFEPESMGDRWRADFDVTLRFRASRGNEETQIAFRSEFLTASGSVEIATLRMRAQQE